MPSVKLLRYPRESYGIANAPTANWLTNENTSLSRLSPALPRVHHEYTTRCQAASCTIRAWIFRSAVKIYAIYDLSLDSEKTIFGFHVFPIIPGGIPVQNESLLLLPTLRQTHLSLSDLRGLRDPAAATERLCQLPHQHSVNSASSVRCAKHLVGVWCLRV